MRSIIFPFVAVLFFGFSSARGERFLLLSGIDARLAPGTARSVFPLPGPGFPGSFEDGDRLAGTSDRGVVQNWQGFGTPLFQPNEFGSLSMTYRRGSIPIPNGQVPLMGIDYLGGPLLDLDGDLNNGSRSLVPVVGQQPVTIPGSASHIDLTVDHQGGTITLLNFDATGSNVGGPNLQPEIGTTLTVIAGTQNDGSQTGPINPTIDTRVGTLTPVPGAGGLLTGVFRIDELGFELWQDSIDPNSATANELGTFQFLGTFRGWLVERDAAGNFPTLSGEGLGGTRWPEVDTSAVGQMVNTANGLAGGSATIAEGVPGDVFSAPNNGGLALTDFGGDLGGYFDNLVLPALHPSAKALVYLESAGFGVNNSGDPVFTDSVSYDVVVVAQALLAGDLDSDGDVDLSDFTVFQICFGGSNNPPAPTCPPGVDADLDGDGDVDLADFLIIQQNFTGSL